MPREAPDVRGEYVGDGYGSHYITQYSKDGQWLRTWGGKGNEKGKMETPHGLWIDDRPGRELSLVVADRANARLQYFSLEGKHLGFVKDVLFPAHFDIRGRTLLVADLHARVSLFDKDNQPLVHLGDDGGFLAVDVDPGASSGDTCDGPQGRGDQGDREAAWLLAQHRAAVLA